MKFKIKNNYIKGFAEFLISIELKGKHQRLRTRFVKQLEKQLQQINEERAELAKGYTWLDDNGNPKTKKDKQGLEFYDFKDDDAKKEWIKEVEILYDEEFIVDGEDKKETLSYVKEIVLECDLSFSGQAAMQYDLWCEIVESIEE